LEKLLASKRICSKEQEPVVVTSPHSHHISQQLLQDNYLVSCERNGMTGHQLLVLTVLDCICQPSADARHCRSTEGLRVCEFVLSAPSQETVTYHQYRALVQDNAVLTSLYCFKSASGNLCS